MPSWWASGKHPLWHLLSLQRELLGWLPVSRGPPSHLVQCPGPGWGLVPRPGPEGRGSDEGLREEPGPSGGHWSAGALLALMSLTATLLQLSDRTDFQPEREMSPELPRGARFYATEARVPWRLGLCSATCIGVPQGSHSLQSRCSLAPGCRHSPPACFSPAEGAPERAKCKGCHQNLAYRLREVMQPV